MKFQGKDFDSKCEHAHLFQLTKEILKEKQWLARKSNVLETNFFGSVLLFCNKFLWIKKCYVVLITKIISGLHYHYLSVAIAST